MTNYLIGDFLIRIKNAAMAGRHEIVVPKTKLIEKTAKVLLKEGFLSDIKTEKGNLHVQVAFSHKAPVLMGLTLMSKPGLRIYMKVDEIAAYKGPETFIISSPMGLIASKEARKKRLGGEVLAKVW